MVVWRHLLTTAKVFGCSLDRSSKYVIVGVPLDNTTTYKPGTRFAPSRIREAACELEFYSITTNKSLEHIGFNDLGDIVVSPGDLGKCFENIEKVVKGIVEEYRANYYIFLGGEHLLTYPILKAIDRDIEHIIVFDAHLDLRNEYLGSKYNHATVMRRIYEETGKTITYFGARAFSEEELFFLENNSDIKIYSVENNIDEISSNTRVYISIDMDVMDPAYAPGVSNPEPLGLKPYTMLKVLEKIIQNNKVIGIDIVEVNPLVDINDNTSLLAAKILLEIIGMLEEY